MTTSHLAVVLPGGNNDPWLPPVLLPGLAAEQAGAHVERISYPGARLRGVTLEESRAFNTAVLGQVTEILERHAPARVTFIAKSRGTLFLAAMDKALVGPDVAAIWVTPLLGLDYVRAGIIDKSWPSLLIAGTADDYFDRAAHAEVCAAVHATDVVIADADHGLVVEGDVLATVEGYRRVAEACLAFMRARA